MKGHAKYEESNALAAISRALKEQQDKPVEKAKKPTPVASEAPADKHKKRKASKEAAPADAAVNDHGKEPKHNERKKDEAKDRAGKEGKQSRKSSLLPPSATNANSVHSLQDAAELCQRLSALAASLACCAGSGEEAVRDSAATLEHALKLASELEAALGRLLGQQLVSPAAAAGGSSGQQREAAAERQALQHSIAALQQSEAQGRGVAPAGPYSPLQQSAAALQVATAAAQLARCIGQLAGRGKARGGQGSGGGAASTAAALGSVGFGQWYLSSFADCFAAELEALQDAEAPAPAAVLRRCITSQASLFPPPFPQLAMAPL